MCATSAFSGGEQQQSQEKNHFLLFQLSSKTINSSSAHQRPAIVARHSIFKPF
jgi:hypothetical protein